jgi:hypothetical protein
MQIWRCEVLGAAE